MYECVYCGMIVEDVDELGLCEECQEDSHVMALMSISDEDFTF